ncbi:MAG: universal stress protein, partial [Solirubrobacteraceae bacterium]
PAETVARRGRVEREVVAACANADLLVLARDGETRLGPKSLGPRAGFVVDHAPCTVLLAWAQSPPGIDTIPVPPHLREHR